MLSPLCSIIDDHNHQLQMANEQINDIEQQLRDKSANIDVLETELDQQREANSRAPTTTMKNMIERLKNQLALKEKQHKVIIVYYFILTLWSAATHASEILKVYQVLCIALSR